MKHENKDSDLDRKIKEGVIHLVIKKKNYLLPMKY